MKVVVGLGNPGPKYVGTRHNIGFDVLEVLANRFSSERWRNRFEAATKEIQIDGERVLLAAPQTYMNLSGRSVRTIVGFFKVDLKDLLLICDDMNLPAGQLRLRKSGSAGGQKGLKNTIDQLGSDNFARLRIGVGRPPESVNPANYVLQTFSKSDRTTMDEAANRAASAVETWVREGIESAMNNFNQRVAGDKRKSSD